MSLRRVFRILLGIQFALGIGLAILTASLFLNQEALSKSQRVHFQSYLLADELRQSSDDLTRLARTYVATGNEKFESQYWTVLDIRNGKNPRPVDYNRIYWDLVAETGQKPRPDGPTISLRHLMIGEGITDAELKKLALSQKYSDELVRTEKIAMNAVKGLFDDGAGNFTIKKEPDRAMALQLMNDEAYHKSKVNIMTPIDEFYGMFAERTAGDVAKYDRRSMNLLQSLGVLITVIMGMFGLSFVVLQRQIAERERAEEALRESERSLRESQVLAGLGSYVLDIPTGFWKSSDVLDTVFGIDEAYERSVEGWAALIHPDDRTMMDDYFRNEVVGRREPVDREYRIIRHDNQAERWVHGLGRLEFDAQGRAVKMRGTIQDITERKQAEEALRASQQIIEGIINAMPVRVFWKDKNLVYLGCNAVFARDKGFADPKDVIGKDDYQIGSRDQAELYRGDDQRVMESGCSKFLIEEPQTTPEGNTITLLTSKIPLRSSEGELTGVLGTYIDITERKQAEEALANSQAQLMQAQKMEAIGRLAGGVAHDFNNILQAMLSLATVMRLRSSSPELAETVAEIEALIRRGAGLTQQLLLFSRREISKTERLDLGELAGTAGVLLGRLIPENIRLVLEIAPNRLWVEGDAGQLQQVIMNLAVNARDAMPDGGTLTVRAFGTDGDAVIEVVDAGQGMDEQTRAHLFEPFFTTKEKGKGTGLGLSVVHGIVKQHGGRIEVDSSPGVGSRFRVVLPEVLPSGERAGAVAGADVGLPLGHGEHVLVVEDEEGARKGLVEVLEYLDYTVTAVGSGEEAGVLPADLVPDLLLTDLMLPGVTGSELAVGLQERWPGLKVILISGYTEDEAVRRGVDKGSVRFLQKPFDMTALAREVRAALDEQAGSPGP